MQKSNVIGRSLLAVVMLLVMLAGCMTTATAQEMDYQVIFHLNYADAPTSEVQTVQGGTQVTQPADPVRPDYAFTGWYTNAVCSKPYVFAAAVNGDMRLFAGWQPTMVTVTYYLMNGTEETITEKVKVGETLNLPEPPVRAGYEFEGWAINQAGSKQYDAAQAVPAHDLTLFASYTQQKAQVAYVFFDGQEEIRQMELGQPAEALEAPARAGYAFVGWFDSAVGGEAFDFTKALTGDVRVYAQWEKTTAVVTYDANYAGCEKTTAEVAVGGHAEAMTPAKRDGYSFSTWYADVACTMPFDFAAAVTDDVTVYAGWTLETYTVSFHANYEGGEMTQTQADFGSTVTMAEDPARADYDFIGWYEDAEGKQRFAPDTVITGDLNLYAGWQSKAESGDRIISYQLNDGSGAMYDSQTYTSTRRIKAPENPSRAGYFFAGWYKDEAGTEKFDFSTERSATSMTLFAKWLKGYTFEAEYTNLEAKPGQGSSDNCMGVDLIQTLKDVLGNGTKMGMSNDHYVGKLYYNGAFLEFRVNAAQDVDDVTLAARLSPDLFDMYFTDETWQVMVNDEQESYGKLNLTGAIAQTDFDEEGNAINGDMNKRPFENYVLSTTVHLNAGENVIRLVTNNKEDHGGTFNAETPLIDCLYLFANTELTWAECHPENIGVTMDDVSYAITYETAAD